MRDYTVLTNIIVISIGYIRFTHIESLRISTYISLVNLIDRGISDNLLTVQQSTTAITCAGTFMFIGTI